MKRFFDRFWGEMVILVFEIIGLFMLVCARLRHVTGSQWGNKKYINMKHLEVVCEEVSIVSR
jgi:hypothetical protein